MNNTFDFNRFKMLAKWDTFTNKQFYIRGTFGLACVLSLFSIFSLYIFHTKWMHEPTAAITFDGVFMNTMAVNIIAIAAIGFFCFAANCFHNMSSKLRRATYLMLPATNLEKYLARYTNITIGGFLLCAIAIIIADFVQFVFSFIITPGFHSSLTLSVFRLTEYITRHPTNDVITIVSVFGSFAFFVHAFYTLGSILFRKYALLISTCIGYVLLYFTAIILKNDIGAKFIMNCETATSFSCNLIYIVILLVLAIICHLSAYKIFTRMQVINNKWINI